MKTTGREKRAKSLGKLRRATNGHQQWLYAMAVLLGALGCAKSPTAHEELGGETHWLKSCDDESDCHTSLSCICGVCTRACESDEACSSLSASAECLESTLTSFAEGCGAAEPGLVCARAEDEQSETDSGGPVTTSEAGTGVKMEAGSPAESETGGEEPAVDGGDRFSSRLDATTGDSSSSDGATNVEVDGSSQQLECPFGADGELVMTLFALPENVACVEDTDCTLMQTSTRCTARCQRAVNVTQVSAIAAELEAFSEANCNGWHDECPEYSAPYCPPSEARCGEDGVCLQRVNCEARPGNACQEDGDSCEATTAWEIDKDRGCIAAPLEDVGCRDVAQGCSEVETYAVDGGGRCYLFPDSCLPARYMPAQDGQCGEALDFCE